MSLDAAPAVDPSPARDRALHALALAADGRDDEAVAEVDLAVALAPATAWVHVARSAVLREAGRRGDALRAADEAVRLAPDDPRAHRERAAALAAMGRLTEARAAAHRAEQLAPEDPIVLRRLGDLAIDVDPSEAERHYRRGVHRDPFSAASHAGLARALRRLGRSEEAELEYERAASSDPSVRELRRRARELLFMILQAAVGTFLAVLALGWVPDIVAARWPEARGGLSFLMAMRAAVGPLALLGWTAVRIRRLSREAPVPPDLREDLRDIAFALQHP
jgi:tetratricopeptide (TPR) repeat protein